jgi:TfoX/Sxy family transcriptional regulator of competence genes
MAETKWKRSPESLVARFGDVLPADPRIERRSMFGYPCAFLNGHMLCGLHQDDFVLRLPEASRARFLEQPGSRIFEPMTGRPMKEYVVVPAPVLANDAAIARWLRDGVDYLSGLAPKAKKAKRAAPTKAVGARRSAAAAPAKAKRR